LFFDVAADGGFFHDRYTAAREIPSRAGFPGATTSKNSLYILGDLI
jgi:hypothetical protein